MTQQLRECYPTGHGFSSQESHTHSQPPVIQFQESNAFFWPLWALHINSHTLHLYKRYLKGRDCVRSTLQVFPSHVRSRRTKHGAPEPKMSAFPVSKRALRTAAPDIWFVAPDQTKRSMVWSQAECPVWFYYLLGCETVSKFVADFLSGK